MAINIYLFLVFVNFFCSEMVSYRFSSKVMTRSRRLVSFLGLLSWACNGSSFELVLFSQFILFSFYLFCFCFCPGVLPRPFRLPSSCFGFLIQVTLAVLIRLNDTLASGPLQPVTAQLMLIYSWENWSMLCIPLALDRIFALLAAWGTLLDSLGLL